MEVAQDNRVCSVQRDAVPRDTVSGSNLNANPTQGAPTSHTLPNTQHRYVTMSVCMGGMHLSVHPVLNDNLLY